MDEGYEAFCMADPVFYDAMHSEQTAGESFPTADRPLPPGWRRAEQDDWFTFTPSADGPSAGGPSAGGPSAGGPDRAPLPLQGWKIHACAARDNAERVLDKVWDYCVPRGIQFKFLRSKAALTSRVSKYAPRGFSGKLVTIYPANDEQCERILRELGEILDGEPGPYILSDLRWGRGPLFVRYGAFVNRYSVDEDGQVVPVIADPDGNLVPDRRDPVFHTPPWVTVPEFLAPHLAARNAVTVNDMPYTVERVVHFSNGGGIYVGRDTRTGERVVLKEARPHAGLDAWGNDAVSRLEREHGMLRRLAGIPGIPRVYDLFWLGEHRFMAMEYVEGEVLSKAIVLRYPLIDPSAGPAEYASFTEWAVGIHRQVEATITAVHERGVVYGDLHLFNVMVRADGTIALIDFEVAAGAGEQLRPGLAQQGFAAPRSTTGFGVDRYALACLRLALFLPMTNLVWLHRVKARHFAEIITEHFPVDPEFLAKGVDVIVPPGTPSLPDQRTEPDPARWPSLRAELVRSIVASATPERDDRLFPGDIQQFAVGGLGLAYGAAGVLYAMSVTGAEREPRFERWLLDRVSRPARGSRLGLFDGLHGAAFALDHLGYQQPALDTLDICLRENWESLGADLFGGLAGIGLNLLHLADRTGEPALRVAGHRAAELVAERLGGPDSDLDSDLDRAPALGRDPDRDRDPRPARDSGRDLALDSGGGPLISGGEHPWAGLMRGWAGQALLLLRAYDDTGDTAFLDRAAVALRHDLRRCVVRPNGTMEVNEGWRSMPYLAAGSTGIGLVLDEYLARRHDERFAVASGQIRLAATSAMYILPGLFTGRAGILLYLAGRSPEPVADPLVARQVRALSWHALPYGGGMAFPGTRLLRLSMDLATGTAGVLLAIGAALHGEPVNAPLLAPTRRQPGAATPAAPEASPSPAPAGAGP
jgi:serine/threonine protein kinase